MELPGDSIGISDILAHRDCPRRMSYGMKRHVGKGLQSDEKTPESRSYATHYGSAIHTAIEEVENGASIEAAVQAAWDKYGELLEPGDVQLLRDDLEIYQSRDFPGTRTVASEDDFRVPLFKHKGRQIYFRFKLDRLYERLDAPGVFIHIDYKSSRHAKSQAEVNEDLQMWAYNWGIREYWPEVDALIQMYDQLRYGQLPVSPKAPKQLAAIKDWLIKEATKILNDEDVREDGLLRPTQNDWCAWCPIMMDCPVVSELSDWSRTKIAVLAPRRPKLKKNGEPSKVMEDVPLDAERLPDYLEVFEDAKAAKRVLERFTDEVAGLLKRLPAEELSEAGYRLRGKQVNEWPVSAKLTLLERLGPEAFCQLVGITKSGLESYFGDDVESIEWALDLAEKKNAAPSVVSAS